MDFSEVRRKCKVKFHIGLKPEFINIFYIPQNLASGTFSKHSDRYLYARYLSKIYVSKQNIYILDNPFKVMFLLKNCALGNSFLLLSHKILHSKSNCKNVF